MSPLVALIEEGVYDMVEFSPTMTVKVSAETTEMKAATTAKKRIFIERMT